MRKGSLHRFTALLLALSLLLPYFAGMAMAEADISASKVSLANELLIPLSDPLAGQPISDLRPMNGQIWVSGPGYIHVDQIRSESYGIDLWSTFDQETIVQLILFDDVAGTQVAKSQSHAVSGFVRHLSFHLYPIGSWVPGDFTLKLLYGQIEQNIVFYDYHANDYKEQVTVTDGIKIVNVKQTDASPGDVLYVNISAFGVTDASELVVTLRNSHRVDVAQQHSARLRGHDVDGSVRLSYGVSFIEGMSFDAAEQYTLAITATDSSRDLIGGASWSDSHRTPHPTLEKVWPDNALKSDTSQHVMLKTTVFNITPDHQPIIELVRWNHSSENYDVVATAYDVIITESSAPASPYIYTVYNSYDLTGTIDIGHLTPETYWWRVRVSGLDGHPRNLFFNDLVIRNAPGFSRIRVPAAVELSAPVQGYEEEYHGYGFTQLFISTSQEELDFVLEGAVGISNPASLIVNLVRQDGVVVGTAGTLAVEGNSISGRITIATPLEDGKGYNLVVLPGGTVVPQQIQLSVSEDSGTVGDETEVAVTLHIPAEMQLQGVAGFELEIEYDPEIAAFTEVNSVVMGTGLSAHGNNVVFSESSSGALIKIAGAAAEDLIAGELARLRFSLLKAGAMSLTIKSVRLVTSDLSLIPAVDYGIQHGSIEVFQLQLQSTATPASLGTLNLVASSAVGAGKISLGQGSNWYGLGGTTLKVSIHSPLNLDLMSTDKFAATLIRQADGTSVQLTNYSFGHGVIQFVSSTPLEGLYSASVYYNGDLLNQLHIMGYDHYGPPNTTPTITAPQLGAAPVKDVLIYLTPSAYVNHAFVTPESNLEIIGEGFTSATTYKVALYLTSTPTADPVEHSLEVASPVRLTSPLSDLPTGRYYLAVLEGSQVLSSVGEKMISITSGEAIISRPSVRINGGAATTYTRKVTLNINPGSYTHMRVANDPADFTEQLPFIAVATSLEHDLSLGFGVKAVYAQFKLGDAIYTVDPAPTIELKITDPTVTVTVGDTTLSRKLQIEVDSGSYDKQVKIAESEAGLATAPLFDVPANGVVQYTLTSPVAGVRILHFRFEGDGLQAKTLTKTVELQVRQPLVSINSLRPVKVDAVFTFEHEVDLRIDPGTYAEYKVANTETELLTKSYTSLGAELPASVFTLKKHPIADPDADDFGSKALYLRFKNLDGVETPVMMFTIDYISDVIPVGDNGISVALTEDGTGKRSGTVIEGQEVELWVKSSIPVTATAEFRFAGGGSKKVPLTDDEYEKNMGVMTYSAKVTIDSTYANVTSLKFTLEADTGATGESEVIELQYLSKPFIWYSYSRFDRVWLNSWDIRQNSTIDFWLNGSPGIPSDDAVVRVYYWLQEDDTSQATTRYMEVPLSETSGSSGIYTQSEDEVRIPAGAQKISHVEYGLTRGSTETRSESINSTVAASLTFTGLDNSSGAYNGFTFTLSSSTPRTSYRTRISGNDNPTEISLPALNASTLYTYTLTDGTRVYAAGEVSNLKAGENRQVTLNAPQPVVFQLQLVDEDDVELVRTDGRVEYIIQKADKPGESYTQFANLNQPLTGLMEGDVVTYKMHFYWNALQQFILPAGGQLTVSTSPQSPDVYDGQSYTLIRKLEVTPIPKVTLTGRIVDANPDAEGVHTPIEGAAVGLYQVYQSKDESGNVLATVYNNPIATTAADGTFTLSAFPGETAATMTAQLHKARLTVTRSGYNTTQQLYFEAELPLVQQENEPPRIQLPDFELQFRDQYFINFHVFVDPAVRTSDLVAQDETSSYLQTQPNVITSVRVFRAIEQQDGTFTKGASVNGWYSGSAGRFYITNNQSFDPDETVIAEVIAGRGYTAKKGSITVTLSKHHTASVDIIVEDRGSIVATVANQDDANTEVHMLVFNSTFGHRVAHIRGINEELSTGEQHLASGTYTVVLLSGENLRNVHRLTRLSALGPSGFGLLDANNQPVSGRPVVVRAASISPKTVFDLTPPDDDDKITPILVPTVTDESLGYLAADGTSISVSQVRVEPDASIVATIAVRYRLSDTALAAGNIRVTNFQARVASREHRATLVTDRSFINGTKINYISTILSGNVTASGPQHGLATFEVRLEEDTALNVDVTITVQAAFSVNEHMTATFDLPAVTITAQQSVLALKPDELASGKKLTVAARGVAIPNSDVVVLDNGAEVGTVISDNRGRWSADFDLVDPGNPITHSLQARVYRNEDRTEWVESNIFYTEALPANSPAVRDIRIWQSTGWHTYFDLRSPNGEDITPRVLVINPSVPVRFQFRILNVDPDMVEYAALVNTFRGNSTVYEAKPGVDHQGNPGFWVPKDAVFLRNPGQLSVFFSLKDEMGVSYITGSSPIEIPAGGMPDNPQIDPASLPREIREIKPEDVLVVSNGSAQGNNSQGQPHTAQLEAELNLGGGVKIYFTGTHQRVSPGEVPSNYFKLQTDQGAYWNAAPVYLHNVDRNGNPGGGGILIRKTVYFESDLFTAITGMSAAELAAHGLDVAASGELGAQSSMLEKADYTSYVAGGVDFVVATSQNPEALGRLGTGMTVFGGVSTAANAMFGRIGMDPAELRRMASAIENPVERNRLYKEIEEFAKATSTSHRINSLIGGVSYGASFFGPIGKGLSYVVSTGGQVFGKKIGSEYEVWSDAIISMIKTELQRQERNKKKPGRKDPINDPMWKIDPSGYVFEATETDRIEGIKATVLHKVGDSFVVWDEAEDWDEVNPQFTDSDGKYGWDVPPGDWMVRFEDVSATPIYLSTETKSIPVPPLHDEVNIGLLSTVAPSVKADGVQVFTDGVDVEFDMYMLPASFGGKVTVEDPEKTPTRVTVANTGSAPNIVLRNAAGNTIPIKEIVLVDWVRNTGYNNNPEDADRDVNSPYSTLFIDSEYFATKIRIIPETTTGRLPLYTFKDGVRSNAEYTVIANANVASYASVSMASSFTAQGLEAQGSPAMVTGTVRYVNASNSTAPLAGVTVSLTMVGVNRTAVTDADGKYTFADVTAGNYNVTMLGNNHVALPVTVKVETGDLATVNITALKRGDVNRDGEVNVADLVRLNLHALEIDPIADGTLEYKAADVNKDGVVNAADMVPINRHALGIELIQ